MGLILFPEKNQTGIYPEGTLQNSDTRKINSETNDKPKPKENKEQQNRDMKRRGVRKIDNVNLKPNDQPE